MSFRDPGPSPDSDRRLFIGLGVTALAVVVVAAVVIVLVNHSRSTPMGASTVARAHPRTAATTVTAPHVINPTATATSTTAQASGTLKPDGGPVPPGFAPTSVTAISDDVWWVLGSAPCNSPPCTSIVRSADAGRSFVGIPAPRTARVTNLRFANAKDGYAYGSQLWSTHDGGATWTHVTGVPGGVSELAASGGYVYADAGEGLYRSPVDTDDWTLIHRGADASLWVQGDEIFLEADANGGPQLLSSANDGMTFASQAGPANTEGCDFVSTGDGVLWAPCSTGMLSNVWRSADGGVRWLSLNASGGETGNPQPNSAPFAAASGQLAVYGSNELYRTNDGGAKWAPVPDFPPAQTHVVYLGFTDITHGVAILDPDGAGGPTARLEVTTNAGASYAPVTIAPG